MPTRLCPAWARTSACSLLFLASCAHQRAYSSSEPVRTSVVVAQELETHCNASDAEACARLGWMKAAGYAGEKNPTAAAPLYEQACRLDSARGCSLLAGLYWTGKGAPGDNNRGLELDEKACKRGWAFSCTRAARLVALVPPPRVHQIRYAGFLAARSKIRVLVIPDRGEPERKVVQLSLFWRRVRSRPQLPSHRYATPRPRTARPSCNASLGRGYSSASATRWRRVPNAAP